MLLSGISRLGLSLVVAYGALFGYSIWSTVNTCPAFLCDLLLLLATLPWSLIFEPQYNVFDLPRPTSFPGRLAVSSAFFLLNSAFLYSAGRFIGGSWVRWRASKT